jgi:phosphoribosyl-ATP pyrophosphohydrolase/phosphoribosyl-AMP cyclohydrolase
MDMNFDKMQGLIPAIIQDAETRQVLMLGYMNKEAYDITVQTGKVTFWSRSRQTIWTKGETSGNYLNVVDIKNDCDQDTLLIRVHPTGPVCHTGTDTCWGEKNEVLTDNNPLLFLSELQDFIEERHRQMPDGSYTTSLFKDGLNRMAQKVGEEALELVIEAVNGSNERMVYEGSDMLYHLIVLMTSKGMRIEQLAEELMQRHNPNWKKH